MPVLNGSKLDANAKYLAVQQQSGIFAGKQGFNVEVKGNTDLSGGAILSQASADNNSLSTDTLSLSKIENQTEFKVEAMSFSLTTNAANSLTGGISGGSAKDSGHASNTTYAAISVGSVTVKSDPGFKSIQSNCTQTFQRTSPSNIRADLY